MKKKLFRLLGLGLAAFSLLSCGDRGHDEIWSSSEAYENGGKLRIVATTTMVQDLVRVIGGEHVEVYGVMADGVNPHSYVERPSDISALKSADLIFYSGLHLEGKIVEKLENMPHAKAVTAMMDPSDLIAPLDEEASYADPHVWGDPILWSKTIHVVVETLSEKDPQNKDQYDSNGTAYREELNALNDWAKNRISEIPEGQRYLVTSHDAFMYYSEAFGINVRAIDGLAPGVRGGPKKVKELVEFIREKQIKTIFPESEANSKGIKAVAQDAGTKISDKELFADATGKRGEMETINGETYDVGTYIGMIKHNVNAIVEGLK